jgi:hypothetical protein
MGKINMNGEFGMRKGEEKLETGRLGIGETVRRDRAGRSG